MKTDTAVALAGAPPASVSGLLIMGYPLESWVLVGTAIYTVLALFVLIRDKFYLPWKEKKDGKAQP